MALTSQWRHYLYLPRHVGVPYTIAFASVLKQEEDADITQEEVTTQLPDITATSRQVGVSSSSLAPPPGMVTPSSQLHRTSSYSGQKNTPDFIEMNNL